MFQHRTNRKSKEVWYEQTMWGGNVENILCKIDEYVIMYEGRFTLFWFSYGMGIRMLSTRPRQCHHVRCYSSNECKPQTKWVGHVQCQLTDVCPPKVMREGYSRRRLSVVNRPRPMRAILGWCCPSLDDVACLMHTCHVRCVLALPDAAWCWPTSLSRCSHATSDTRRPWWVNLQVVELNFTLGEENKPFGVGKRMLRLFLISGSNFLVSFLLILVRCQES